MKTFSISDDNLKKYKCDYYVGMKCYKVISYKNCISTFDIEHIYEITECFKLYDFIPMGTCYCKETNTYINGNLFVFAPLDIYKQELKQYTLFDFENSF